MDGKKALVLAKKFAKDYADSQRICYSQVTDKKVAQGELISYNTSYNYYNGYIDNVDLVVGDIYKVRLDSGEYLSKCEPYDDGFYLGNPSIEYSNSQNTGESFFVKIKPYAHDSNWEIDVYDCNFGNSFAIIDLNIIFPQTELTMEGSGEQYSTEFLFSVPLNEGDVLEVAWDNEVTTHTVMSFPDAEGALFVGDLETAIPYVLGFIQGYMMVMSCTTSPNHTLAIRKLVEEVHTLDNKYLSILENKETDVVVFPETALLFDFSTGEYYVHMLSDLPVPENSSGFTMTFDNATGFIIPGMSYGMVGECIVQCAASDDGTTLNALIYCPESIIAEQGPNHTVSITAHIKEKLIKNSYIPVSEKTLKLSKEYTDSQRIGYEDTTYYPVAPLADVTFNGGLVHILANVDYDTHPFCVHGTTTRVTLDGEEYICHTTKIGSDNPYIGNKARFDGTGDTGEPFYCDAVQYSGNTYRVRFYHLDEHENTSGETTHQVSVISEITTLGKIDPKFLPEDGVGYVEKMPVESIPMTEVTTSRQQTALGGGYSYFALFATTASLIAGKSYTVIFDGKSYTDVVAKKYDTVSGVSLGNDSLANSNIPQPIDTGEPFLIGVNEAQGYGDITTRTNAVHTFAVYEEVEKVHPIDPKFLPGAVLPMVQIETVVQNDAQVAQLTESECTMLSDVAKDGKPIVVSFTTIDNEKSFAVCGVADYNCYDGISYYTITVLTATASIIRVMFFDPSGQGNWAANTMPGS